MPAVDLHRREHARQCRAGLHGGGDRHVVPAGRAEHHRFARVEVGGDQEQLALQLAEVVAAALRRVGAVEEAVDAGDVEDAGRDGPRQALEGLEEALPPGVRQVVPDRGQQERRHREGAHGVLAEGRLEQQFRREGLFGGVALDEHVAHALGRQPVGQAGGDEPPGAHADIDIQIVQVEPLQRLGQRQQRTEFVDGAQWPAAGKRQAYAGSGRLWPHRRFRSHGRRAGRS
jgi:hypothetical protein